MFSVLSNTRNSNLNVAIAVAITLIVVFAFLAVPSFVAPQPAPIPVTGSQDVNSATRSYIAWAKYLLGEKDIK